MGHEPFHHFGPDRLRQGGIKVVGAGQNPRPVNDIVHARGNAGGNALCLLYGNDRLDKALALGQKLDKLFIDNVDFLAELRNTCLFHWLIHAIQIRSGRGIHECVAAPRQRVRAIFLRGSGTTTQGLLPLKPRAVVMAVVLPLKTMAWEPMRQTSKRSMRVGTDLQAPRRG